MTSVNLLGEEMAKFVYLLGQIQGKKVDSQFLIKWTLEINDLFMGLCSL